jgi:REP element-mobilizing transposase RayT
MARKPRLHVPGGLYHVILRGNARQDIFFTVEDRRRFYELLAEGVERYGYRVHAFCLMTNHVHLALQAGDQALSVGLQNLSFRYTRHLNARLKRVGHLFEGRFKAYLVDRDSYGLSLVRYIHLNPVRARMVQQPAAYPHSSHRAYLGRGDLPWLTIDWMLAQFGPRMGVARSRFVRFVNAGRAEGHNDAFYGGKADSRIVGEEDFVRKILWPKRKPSKPPSIDALKAHVRSRYDLAQKELLAAGRSRRPAEARALIAWLALKSRSASLTQLAQTFQRDLSTLSHAVSRLEARSRKSPAFAKTLDRHLYAISQA